MASLAWATFVVQRRINREPEDVLRTISNPAIFGAGCVLSSDRDGSFRLDRSFQRWDASGPPAWRAPATLFDARGRRVATVEVELGPWSGADTELLVRPLSRRTPRWTGRRARRYFSHAHRAADDLTHLLSRGVARRQKAPLPAYLAFDLAMAIIDRG